MWPLLTYATRRRVRRKDRAAELDREEFTVEPWQVEPLENRCMLAGDTFATAELISVAPGQSATVSDATDPINDVDIYAFSVNAGESVSIRLDAQGPGSAAGSQLRLFAPDGTLLDQFASVDPAIYLRAPVGGFYFVGVSDARTNYDPFATGSAFGGFATADFDLTVSRLAGDGVAAGQVFADFNTDGIRDANEIGLNFARILLYDDSDTLIGSTVTTNLDFDQNSQIDPFQEQGWYLFAGLEPGDYRVEQQPSIGTSQTFPQSSERLFGIPFDDDNAIVELDPQTGAELNRFAAPITVGQPGSYGLDGLAFDGGSLFLISYQDSGVIYELDPDTGVVLDSDPIPSVSDGLTLYSGLGFVNDRLYVMDITNNDLIEFDPVSDQVTNRLDIEAINPGLFLGTALTGATDPARLIATDLNNQFVYSIDPTTGVATFFTTAFGPGLASVDTQAYLADLSANPRLLTFNQQGTFSSSLGLGQYIVSLGGDNAGTNSRGHRITLQATNLTVINNFGLRFLQSNLSTNTFHLIDEIHSPGSEIRFEAAILNDGEIVSSLSSAEVVLSTDPIIDAGDIVVATLELPSIFPQQTYFLSEAIEIPPELSSFENLYVGLRVDPFNVLFELNELDNSNQGLFRDVAPLRVVPATEVESNDTLTGANPIPRDAQIQGAIGASGDVDNYFVSISNENLVQFGRLTVEVRADAGSLVDPVVKLFGPEMRLIATSDDVSTVDNSAGITQYLTSFSIDAPENFFLIAEPRSFFIQVSGANGTVGDYTLTTEFEYFSTPPYDIVNVGFFPSDLAEGDFNRDGIVDFAFANFDGGQTVSVFHGLGDGTYLFVQSLSAGVQFVTSELLVDDFNGDGWDDLALANQGVPIIGQNIGIFFGLPGGSFASFPTWISAGGLVQDMVTGDFNEDGFRDIAAINTFTGTMNLLLGDGNGAFAIANSIVTGNMPSSISLADVNNDNHSDLIVTNIGLLDQFNVTTAPGDVTILLGNGDGGFAPVQIGLPSAPFQGPHPTFTTTGDFNNDSLLDLVVSDGSTNSPDRGRLIIYLGSAGGGFGAPVEVSTGLGPVQVLAVDVNDDGNLDLVNTNNQSNDIAVLLGDGTGDFSEIDRVAVGANPTALSAGDYNRDGRIDLAVLSTTGLTILPGLGDGTFLGLAITATGLRPEATATADFNNDGFADVATANNTSSDISILLNSGNLTLEEAARFDTGLAPIDIVAADFNRDGRVDLATANLGVNQFVGLGGGTISVLLGIGDGRFTEHVDLVVPAGEFPAVPSSLTAIDLNGDQILDLVTNDLITGQAFVFLGTGDGSFVQSLAIPVGDVPLDLLISDINGDGTLDVISANSGTFPNDAQGNPTISLGNVSVLLGNADGSYSNAGELPAGVLPASVITADFNGDQVTDLAVANQGNTDFDIAGEVFVYLGVGDGSFAAPEVIAISPAVENNFDAEAHLEDLQAGDVNGDGIIDLVVANFGDSDDLDALGNIAVLLGNGDGTFELFQDITEVSAVSAILLEDFNNDGRLDLAAASAQFHFIGILEGFAGGVFFSSFRAANAIASDPLFDDFNGDGLQDALVVSGNGDILLRLGRDQEGSLDAPILVNPEIAARAATVVEVAGETLIAAVDRDNNAVTLYQINGDEADVVGTLVTGEAPTRIATADLNGDNRDDLVVATILDGTINVYLGQADGSFVSNNALSFATASGSVDLQLDDVDGNDTIDLLIVNQVGSDVLLFLNDGTASFTAQGLYRAGDGPYFAGLDTTGDARSGGRERTVAIATGDFNEDGHLDTVLANPATHDLGLLFGGDGGFINVTMLPVAAAPTQVITDDFSGDGHLDLAVLSAEAEQLLVFLGDGAGNFMEGVTLSLNDNSPVGLSTLDVNRDTFLDLVVSNRFGDLLILPGNGDGSFEPFLRVDRTVSLALNDLNGDQQNDEVLVGNTSRDELSLQEVNRLATELGFEEVFEQDRDDDLLAPGAVSFLDINGDGMRDLVVANTGGNNLLIYLADAAGGFSTANSFSVFTGTNPTGITGEDLNADGFVDLLVANRGSNDVAVLFSQTDALGAWSGFLAGPRLETGTGPVSSEVIDQNGDGMLDLLVTNSLDGTVSVLPGVGGGFFDDVNRLTIDLPGATNGFGTIFEGAIGFATLLDGSIAQFDASSLTSRVVASGVGARSVAPFDFDSDGRLELVVASANGSVSLFFNDGNAFFADPNFVFTDPNLQSPSAVALARLGESFEIYVTDEGEEIVTVFQLEETVTDLKKFLAETAPPGDDPAQNLLALVLLDNPDDADQLAERGVTSQFDSSGFNPDQINRIVRELAASLDRVTNQLLSIGSEVMTLIRVNEGGVVVDVIADQAYKVSQFAPQLLPGPATEVVTAIEYVWDVAESASSQPTVDDEESFADMLREALAPWATLFWDIVEDAQERLENETVQPEAGDAKLELPTDDAVTLAPVSDPQSGGSGLGVIAPAAVATLALSRAAKRKKETAR